MSTIKRVYYYLVCLISLGILTAGIRTLLFLLFNTIFNTTPILRPDNFIQQQLSLGLAMLVIGGPLWFIFWRSVQRQVNNHSTEIGSAIRKFYLNLVLLVTALITIVSAASFLVWLISGLPQEQGADGSLAFMISAAMVWFYHWKVSEGEGHPSSAAKTFHRWYVYIISGFGLIWLSTGLVRLIYNAVYYLIPRGDAFIHERFWGEPVSWIVLGGLWWAFHWFRMAKGDFDSTLRQVYIYLLAIVGSSIAGLVALVITVNQVLVWVMGVAETSAGDHFRFLGWTISTIIVAGAIWGYHQLFAQEEASRQQERRLSSKRIHLYIMSFLGLGTLVAGLIILLGILLNLITNAVNTSIIVETGWWQKQLALALALLVVALPLWWYYWRRVTRLANTGGLTEWKARSRRIYLYVIIAAAILTLAADLVNIIFQILSGALTGNFSIEVLKHSMWSLQSLVVAIPLLIYHWRIAREDQKRGVEAAVVKKEVSILAGAEAADLISRLEEKLGTKMRILQYTGLPEELPAFSDETINDLVKQIESSPITRIMLVVHQGQVLVLPYQPK